MNETCKEDDDSLFFRLMDFFEVFLFRMFGKQRQVLDIDFVNIWLF